jgi:hypothetical protein
MLCVRMFVYVRVCAGSLCEQNDSCSILPCAYEHSTYVGIYAGKLCVAGGFNVAQTKALKTVECWNGSAKTFIAQHVVKHQN